MHCRVNGQLMHMPHYMYTFSYFGQASIEDQSYYEQTCEDLSPVMALLIREHSHKSIRDRFIRFTQLAQTFFGLIPRKRSTSPETTMSAFLTQSVPSHCIIKG